MQFLVTGNTATGAGRTPFPNQMIPASRISPIFQDYMSLLPEPTLPTQSNNIDVATDQTKKIYSFVTNPGLYGPGLGIYGGPSNSGFDATGPALNQSPGLNYKPYLQPNATGFPAPQFLQIPANGIITNAPNGNYGITPPNVAVPYIESWNFTIQHMLPGFEAGYVGNHAIGLENTNVINSSVNINAAPVAGLGAGKRSGNRLPSPMSLTFRTSEFCANRGANPLLCAGPPGPAVSLEESILSTTGQAGQGAGCIPISRIPRLQRSSYLTS